MTTLRLTAIMKTDLSGSTARFRGLRGADLDAVLGEHRQLVARLAAAEDGRIVKPEGDGFWVVFPSVTAAAVAAMAMQEELRLVQPNRGDDRLAMRIVITLGDVVHQEGALVGDPVVFASRLEAITPPDEIYLSAAAWLALNRAEVRSAFVDNVTLKGFPDPAPVYRVAQTHRTRVIADQYIVFADLRGCTRYAELRSMGEVEQILDELFDLTNRASREFDGANRFSIGDAYCLTFPQPAAAIQAAERLVERWARFASERAIDCPMNVAIHKGTLHAYRTNLWGRGLEVAVELESESRRVLQGSECSIFATGEVRRDLAGSAWDARLRPVDIQPFSPRLAGIDIYRLATSGQGCAPGSGTSGFESGCAVSAVTSAKEHHGRTRHARRPAAIASQRPAAARHRRAQKRALPRGAGPDPGRAAARPPAPRRLGEDPAARLGDRGLLRARARGQPERRRRAGRGGAQGDLSRGRHRGLARIRRRGRGKARCGLHALGDARAAQDRSHRLPLADPPLH
jgi:class 3 adenylate cyclase